MATAPQPRPGRSELRRERRHRTRWYTIPPGRSHYLAVPRTGRIGYIQDWHSAIEERLYELLDKLLPTAFVTPDGEKVVKLGYAEARVKCAMSRSSVRRAIAGLRRKWSIRIWSVDGAEHDPHRATYYVVHRWDKTHALRLADPTIGQDAKGRMYVLGRGRHPLPPADIELWQLNKDYGGVQPGYASVPVGGEDDYLAWAQEHPEERGPLPTREQAPLVMAEPPPEEGQVKGAIPQPITRLLQTLHVTLPDPARAWRFIGEVRRAAAKLGHAQLTVEQIALLMRIRSSATQVRGFGYFVTAVPNALEVDLRTLDEQEEQERARKAAQQAEQERLREQAAAEERLYNDPDYWRQRIRDTQARIAEARLMLRGIDVFHPDHGKLKREIETMKHGIEGFERELQRLAR